MAIDVRWAREHRRAQLREASVVTERVAEAVAPLTEREFDTLHELALEWPNGIPMTLLADRVGMTSGGFTKLADRLEAHGLVQRVRADDRRKIITCMTDAGQSKYAKAAPAYDVAVRGEELR